jgi:cephalosporin hydroxylase
MRREVTRTESLRQALDLAFDFELEDVRIAPFQVRSEIEAFLELLAAERPGTVLEIGTAQGGTLFLFAHVASSDATLVTVDLSFGGRGALYRAFARKEQSIRLLEADSHRPETVEAVRRELRGRPLDLLFVDGDHSLHGVRRDVELYRPLVRPGGLIALHDIVPGPAQAVGGVPELWSELKSEQSGSVSELVADWQQGGFGIGVLRRSA